MLAGPIGVFGKYTGDITQKKKKYSVMWRNTKKV
jgi:hypothetical protein